MLAGRAFHSSLRMNFQVDESLQADARVMDPAAAESRTMKAAEGAQPPQEDQVPFRSPTTAWPLDSNSSGPSTTSTSNRQCPNRLTARSSREWEWHERSNSIIRDSYMTFELVELPCIDL